MDLFPFFAEKEQGRREKNKKRHKVKGRVVPSLGEKGTSQVKKGTSRRGIETLQ